MNSASSSSSRPASNQQPQVVRNATVTNENGLKITGTQGRTKPDRNQAKRIKNEGEFDDWSYICINANNSRLIIQGSRHLNWSKQSDYNLETKLLKLIWAIYWLIRDENENLKENSRERKLENAYLDCFLLLWLMLVMKGCVNPSLKWWWGARYL